MNSALRIVTPTEAKGVPHSARPTPRRRISGLVFLLLCSSLFAQAPKPAPKPAAGATPPSTGVPASWKQIPIAPLPPFNPQKPKRIELANGMVIFLQEDHELPLIDGTLRIRGGDTEVPKAKNALMSLYGQVWRLGGTQSLTGDQMDEFLEARAASVTASGGSDSTSLSWSCLKNDFDDVFKLAVDLLRNPAFREDKIALIKTQLNGVISHRNDDLGSVIGRETAKVAYGEDHPYGRVMEYDNVAAVTRQDLVDFHQRHLQPNNIIIGVVGDFDPARMEAALRQAFESWPKGPAYVAPRLQFPGPKPGIYFAEKSDVNQSEIRMVHLGIQRNNPDLYAVDVMDEIFFSGGFSARFTNVLRTQLGLAYAAGGSISAPYDHPGLFTLRVGTKSESTVQAIEAMRKVVANLDKEPATVADLKRAKDSILNSFVFRYDSKDKLMAERMTLEFFGYPVDFVEKYRAGIDKVTLADVARVAQKYVHPEQLALVVVGKKEAFDKPLATLGQVKELDITIPPPGGKSAGGGGSAVPAPAMNTPEARAALAKVVNFLGGEAKLRDIRAVKQTVNTVRKIQGQEIPLTIEYLLVFPDQARTVVQTPMGPMTTVVGPGAAYQAMGPRSRDLPASARQSTLHSIQLDIVYIYVGRNAGDPGKVKVGLSGTEKVGDIEAQVLALDVEGSQVRWWIDPASGRLLKSEAQDMGPQGPVQAASEFADWKLVEGINVPHSITQFENGEQMGKTSVQTTEINPAVDPKLFEKPEPPKAP